MPVTFEFEVGNEFHFSKAFAAHFNVPVINERVYLPENLGTGFIQEVYLNNGLALCIHSYILKEEFHLKRLAVDSSTMLTMKFDFRKALVKSNGDLYNSLFSQTKQCEVEFGSSSFFSEVIVPANQEIVFLVIGAQRKILIDLLQADLENHSLLYMLQDNKPLLWHEGMTQEMERALKQLSQINQSTKLPFLLYEVKTLELIYLLLNKLLTRRLSTLFGIVPQDLEKIYKVRAEILKDLTITPLLPELAMQAGMSLTKMKQLFNQVFGKSIYNYYQAERMNLAAGLLRNLSVAEAGYHVGFSNLSHFGRLFEKHYQMKPKKFKNTLVI